MYKHTSFTSRLCCQWSHVCVHLPAIRLPYLSQCLVFQYQESEQLHPLHHWRRETGGVLLCIWCKVCTVLGITKLSSFLFHHVVTWWNPATSTSCVQAAHWHELLVACIPEVRNSTGHILLTVLSVFCFYLATSSCVHNVSMDHSYTYSYGY